MGSTSDNSSSEYFCIRLAPRLWLLLMLILLAACNSYKLPQNTKILSIQQLNDHLFLHISYLETENFGKVACNGLVYFSGNEAIIFDSPTNDAASKQLIEWIEDKNLKEIKAVVVTHFHEDCLGGLKEFHQRGVTSYASTLTLELARANNYNQPMIGFDAQFEFELGGKQVITTYYGEGHTPDNVVGYIPEEHALFGGCLIKATAAGRGNLEDANTEEWPKTVSRIKRQLPDLQIVVPGHGKTGGQELLDYTITLFQQK